MLHRLRKRVMDTGCGALVIMNQLSQLANFDEVIFLQDGEVAVQGTLEEALSHPGFAEFARDVPLRQCTT